MLCMFRAVRQLTCLCFSKYENIVMNWDSAHVSVEVNEDSEKKVADGRPESLRASSHP